MDDDYSFSIDKIKENIYQLICANEISPAVIDTLFCKKSFVRKECELWDFKQKPSQTNEKLSNAKTLLQILSFHNAYGGYLIYGVDETKEDFFEPVGIQKDTFKRKQLRDLSAECISDSIDFNYEEYEVQLGEWSGLVGVLQVPKRQKNVKPLYFTKNGPADEKGKLTFEKDSVYLRTQDNCILAKKQQHWEVINSDRELAFGPNISYRKSKPVLDNNLPHRSLICAKFIGRDSIIEELWEWLGDSFAHSKLLAGDGGKGKSSIAYEFSEKVCNTNPYEFEQVIWLTGKKKQFIGIQNEYQDTPEIHFHDLESMLVAIGEYLGLLDSEMEMVSLRILKTLIKKHLNILPAFVVIDDVDSLDIDEQRKVMETVMQLSGGESKFLLTTRMNLVYSTDLCITVPGLALKDYQELSELYRKRFEIPKLSKNNIKVLHNVTDGSPLFTESLLRLIKLGVPFHKAVGEWKGEAGDDVRRAALKREIDTLSPESKRVLYALSLMSEASATELRQVSACQITKFEKSINDLSSLFLISSPPIIKTEKRYRVSKNTALLVVQNKSMITNPRSIEKKVKDLKSKSVPVSKKPKIGAAINQAFALLKEGRFDEALKTINSTLVDMPNNKDLLFVKARCLMQVIPKSINDVRKFYHLSYSNGQRKPEFFDYWYEAELEAKDATGLIDVSRFALESPDSDRGKWLINSAIGYKYLSEVHKSTSNSDGALESLVRASEELYKAKKSLTGTRKEDAISHSISVNEDLWLLSSARRDTSSIIKSLDIVLNIIENGDIRNTWYYRAEDSLSWLVKSSDNINIKWINFIEQRIKKLRVLVMKRSKHESAYDMNLQVTNTLNRLSNTVAEWDEAEAVS